MSVPSWVRKGALVVCVDADDRGGVCFAPRDIKEREIYTIAAVNPCGISHSNPNLVLVEVPNPYFGRDVGWNIDRFRPLVDDANDNEIETVLYRKRKGKKSHSVPRRKSVDA